jgi:hypothetical protein
MEDLSFSFFSLMEKILYSWNGWVLPIFFGLIIFCARIWGSKLLAKKEDKTSGSNQTFNNEESKAKQGIFFR